MRLRGHILPTMTFFLDKLALRIETQLLQWHTMSGNLLQRGGMMFCSALLPMQWIVTQILVSEVIGFDTVCDFGTATAEKVADRWRGMVLALN
jgi:hypothetical protein